MALRTLRGRTYAAIALFAAISAPMACSSAAVGRTPSSSAAPQTGRTASSSARSMPGRTSGPTADCAKPSAADAARSPAGWRLTIADDFDGNTLQHCWSAYQKYSGSGHPLSSLVTVGGGYLTLYARGQDTGDVSLETPLRYGRFEFRACTYATRGAWSGIFLWPSGPPSSEIDIVEGANEQHSWFNLHWGNDAETDQQIPFPGGAPSEFNAAAPTGPAGCRQWHTWAFEWTPKALTLTMDGRQVAQRTDSAMVNRFNQPMNLLLEMERGMPGFEWSNGAPTDTSVSALYVDWVKVYAPIRT